MDRRTVLAFALIFLIFVGSQAIISKFFPPEEQPLLPDSTMVQAEVVAPVETSTAAPESAPAAFEEIAISATGPASVAEAATLVSDGTSRQVKVLTPLYELLIETQGCRIVSWKGLEHGSYKGGNVQLIPEEIPAFGTDAVLFRQGTIELGQAVFTIDRIGDLRLTAEDAPQTLVFSAKTAWGLEIQRVFTFDPESYGFETELIVRAYDQGLADKSLALLGAADDVQMGWNQGIAPTERIQKMEEQSMRSVSLVGDQFEYKKLSGLKKSVEKVQARAGGSVHFAALQNRYFAIYGIVPQKQGEPVEGSINLSGDPETQTQSWWIKVPARRGSDDEIVGASLDMYIGPQQTELLEVYGQDLEGSVDLGYRWIRPLSQLVLLIMEKLNSFIPNYGVIIILFSILTKLAFYPLTKSQTQSMKKMAELQPKLKALQAKHKDDKEKLNQATMKLYSEEKVNPLAGCLPLLVQMPVFFALYQALSHTISLRGQPFVLWINDLSQPDALFQMPFALPFLGSDFNLLPLLMSVAMYFQTKLTPTAGGGGQMAAMTTMMPLIMVVIFYNMPSGLVLYWLVNTLLQGYQSWKIHKTAPGDGGKVVA